MTTDLLLMALRGATAQAPEASGTGLEWMMIASFLVPAALLAVILYMGSRKTV